jgi:hypothetical protein
MNETLPGKKSIAYSFLTPDFIFIINSGAHYPPDSPTNQ